jgi:steroid delta-isomerase-like uncharacterized protein
VIRQDENLAAIGKWNDAFNRHDALAALACLADNVADDGNLVGRDGFAALFESIRSSFPDAQIDSREIVAVGDHVVDRAICSGTHRAAVRLPVFGGQLVGLPPTGKRFSVQHIHWWTLKDGKIIGHRACRDDMAMLMQLGLLPAVPLVAQPAYLDEPSIPHRHVVDTEEQERNLAVIRANQRAYLRRDIEGVLATFADQARNHGRGGGRERMRLVFSDIFRTYTPVDSDDGIREIVAVDDCVVVRFERLLRHTGTSQMPIDGGLLMGVPPTDRTFIQKHIHWWTLNDGLITSHRACRDDVGEMMQLGLLPPSPMAAAGDF